MVIGYLADAKPEISKVNYVAFLEMWPEIQKAHALGYSYKLIWRGMFRAGAVTYQYENFTYYVRKAKKLAGESKPPQNKPVAQNLPISKGEPPSTSPTRVDMPIFGRDRKPGTPIKF